MITIVLRDDAQVARPTRPGHRSNVVFGALVVGHSRGSSHDDRKAQESKEARLKEYHNVRGRENQDSRCLMKPSWRNRRAFYKSRNGG